MMAIVWNWTPERVEELRTLWEQGHTIGEIAARFGISRGAVIGKVRRHGFVRAGQPPREPYKRGVRKKYTAEERAARKEAAAANAPFELQCQSVPIMELRGEHCRFIVQEVGETLYCGAPKIAGGSWCAEHRAKCFQQRSAS